MIQPLESLQALRGSQQLVEGGFTNNCLEFYQGKITATYYLPVYVRMRVNRICNIQYIQKTVNMNVQIRILVNYKDVSRTIKNLMTEKGIRVSFNKNDSLILNKQNKNAEFHDDEQACMFQFTLRKQLNANVEFQKVCKLDSVVFTPFQTMFCHIRVSLNKLVISDEEYREYEQRRKEIKDRMQRVREQLSQRSELLNRKSQIDIEKSLDLVPKILQNEQNNDLSYEIHFNMMDNPDIFKKLSISSSKNFGMFRMVPKKCEVFYTHSKILPEFSPADPQKKQQYFDEQERVRLRPENTPKIPHPYNYAHFKVFMYKQPFSLILALFVPILLMAILNLGIFYQSNNIHKRMVTIASILISFIAMTPQIRRSIPSVPKITLIELLIYLESGTTAIFAFIDSIIIKDINGGDGNYKHENPFQVDLFRATFAITIIVYLIVILMLLKYRFWNYPEYVEPDNKVETSKNIYKNVQYGEWSNIQCDIYFSKYRQIIQKKSSRKYIPRA